MDNIPDPDSGDAAAAAPNRRGDRLAAAGQTIDKQKQNLPFFHSRARVDSISH